MTREPSLIGLFITPLNRAGIEYMVTGGLAAIVYGQPRLTLDIDLVVRLAGQDAALMATLWPAADFYFPPVEVFEEAMRAGTGHFNVIHNTTMLRADVYVTGAEDLSSWALGHRVPREVEGERVQFAPIEYVIVMKLSYYQMGGSDRHLRDIARMLEVSGSEVDRPTLDRWIARMQLGAEWAQAIAHREPD